MVSTYVQVREDPAGDDFAIYDCLLPDREGLARSRWCEVITASADRKWDVDCHLNYYEKMLRRPPVDEGLVCTPLPSAGVFRRATRVTEPDVSLLSWNLALLAEQLCAILTRAEASLALEQAVKGLDALGERDLQSLLAEGLGRHYPVKREVHYPSTKERKNNHRPRCDLVLPTLDGPFEKAPAAHLWLEMKVASQLAEDGTRHRGYTRRWHAMIADLQKMTVDPAIQHGALVLVLFTESLAILEKDLNSFETLLVQQRVIAGFRHVRTLRVQDRIGHRYCSVALWPTLSPACGSRADS